MVNAANRISPQPDDGNAGKEGAGNERGISPIKGTSVNLKK